MKTPRIVNALNHIDSDLVSGALSGKATRRNAWIKWSSVAACFVLLFALIITIAPKVLDGDDNDSLPIVDEENTNNGPGEEIQLEKYYAYRINDGVFSAFVGGKVISEDQVGDKIEDVVVTAGWKNEAGEWLSNEDLNAEVYLIEGVESEVAAALRFIDKGEAVTTTHYYVIMDPNAEYNGKVFPDYNAENPVKYLEESDMGKSNGWQDFGMNGEIRTITVPVGSTYVYQMYSYYIRNDLTHIYWDQELPNTIEELPEWLSDTVTAGRKSFWYSMGKRIPQSISLNGVTQIASEDDTMRFIQAEYKIQITDGASEKEENWVVYFMEENGTYSAFAVIAHENFDFVKSYSETIVKSYQKKEG